MKYLLIEFTKGLNCQAYQEISEDGRIVLRNLDLDGNELFFSGVTESRVVDPEYVVPYFALQNP